MLLSQSLCRLEFQLGNKSTPRNGERSAPNPAEKKAGLTVGAPPLTTVVSTATPTRSSGSPVLAGSLLQQAPGDWWPDGWCRLAVGNVTDTSIKRTFYAHWGR